MGRVVDISGVRYGRVVVLSRASNNRHGRTQWLCRCDCGVEKVIASAELRAGKTISCGCWVAERFDESRRVHGMSHTQEYAIYRGMIARCENPNVKAYDRYGGRGICVASSWRNDFLAFLRDLGPRPSPDHSLERLDPDGNYEPGNVVWSTNLAQANNKRKTRYVTYRGAEMPLCDAVRLAGSVIHREAAWVRIRSGWSVERAVETPRKFESPNSRNRTSTGTGPAERLS